MCQDDATPERNEKDLPPRGFLETDKLKKNEKWASFFSIYYNYRIEFSDLMHWLLKVLFCFRR